jgi:hypothetical protein
MSGVSRALRYGIVTAALAVGLLPASATAGSSAPASVGVPAVRTYPLQHHSLPSELRPKAQAKLPKIATRVVELVGDDMDQDSLLPVQMVSALHIRNAFRKPLGNDAWRSAVRIAWRESRLLPNVVNDKNRNKSEDWGLFQLNDGGTLQYVGGAPGTKAPQPRWNARAAARLVASQGWDPWGGIE